MKTTKAFYFVRDFYGNYLGGYGFSPVPAFYETWKGANAYSSEKQAQEALEHFESVTHERFNISHEEITLS